MKDNRPSARERGYDSEWQRERGAFLAQPENQFCERCTAAGILNAGHLRMDGSPQTNPKRMHLVINHRIPHKGDKKFFWDRRTGRWLAQITTTSGSSRKKRDVQDRHGYQQKAA